MKNQDFIAQNINVIPAKERKNTSIIQDPKGNFYSYGYHYPLLVKVENVWLVNIQGFSHATAVHIKWAKQHADFEVDLDFADQNYHESLEDTFRSAILGELKYLESTLSKPRKLDSRSTQDLMDRAHSLEQAKLHTHLGARHYNV